MKKIHFFLATIVTLFSNISFCQDSTAHQIQKQPSNLRYHTVIIPAAMIIYGGIAVKNNELKKVNQDIQIGVTPTDLTQQIHLDNYLQFAPAVIALGLNTCGVRGKHNLAGAAMIYAMSNIFLNVVTIPTKQISHELRPNELSYSSFPSGHTAEAFASAEFLRMEYQDKSIWYGVLGYSMACMTGYLRMYNNKHWFSDVAAGAGIGILSTRLAEYIYSKLEPKLFGNRNKSNTLFMPFYKDNNVGIGLTHQF